jgi:hypothetical protein
MPFILQELVDRARVYLADDNDDGDTGALISDPAAWLRVAQASFDYLYPQWVRAGLVPLNFQTDSWPGSQTVFTLTNTAIALIGVAQDYGDGTFRLLESGVPRFGETFWGFSTGTGYYYSIRGTPDELDIVVEPIDVSATYTARYLARPNRFAGLTDTAIIPFGCDEQMVIDMARRAKLKESAVSQALEQFKREHLEAMNMAGPPLGIKQKMANGIRVTPFGLRGTTSWPTDPRYWRWFV